MGLWRTLFGGSEQHLPVDVEEAATSAAGPSPDRTGYEYGVPHGGVDTDQKARSAAATRQQVMEQLYQAYLACAPVSACVDTTARMVTAGGLELVPEDGSSVDDENRPPAIKQLDQLMRTTNPQEDLIQLARSTITDLLVFGDGFIELGTVATVPAALWTLDGTTMQVKCDEHGELTGYLQQVDGQRFATFDPDEVIHVSLDSPRGGIYGVSPTQKMLVPVTAWLFTAGVLKEFVRQGAPKRIAVDLGKDTQDTDMQRWLQQYKSGNIGPRNQWRPIVTRVHPAGNAAPPPIHDLTGNYIPELITTLDMLRDQIISGFGMTPAMVGVIESGNLGGGTGESQARTFHYGTVVPLQNLLLEKLNYRLLFAQGIDGWKFQFGEVDYRDSKVVEDIRDQRLRNGSWTLNDYLTDIGHDPIPAGQGGDDHVLVDRQNLVLWADIPAFSKAMVASKNPLQQPGTDGQQPPGQAPVDKTAPGEQPGDGQGVGPGDGTTGPTPPTETAPARDARRLDEAWLTAYKAQRRRALRELPMPDDVLQD